MEELDSIDYARLNRALAAKNAERVLHESVKKNAGERLSSDDWALVKELDELDRQYYG